METTSIVSSQSRVGRGPGSRRKGRLCRLAGGGLERESEGDTAKSERKGKGFPQNCLRLGSGIPLDPVPKGRDWHMATEMRHRQSRTFDFS